MYAIVAACENWGIGKNNALLYHISADLKRFKALTDRHTVIMGRKTLESLPGKRGLPDRRNIVLTSQGDYAAENAEIVNTVMAAVFTANDAESFVIGGESVYRALLPACDKVYLTRVFASPEADAFFPDLDELPDWKITEKSEIMEEDGIRFQYLTYERKAEDDFYTLLNMKQ